MHIFTNNLNVLQGWNTIQQRLSMCCPEILGDPQDSRGVNKVFYNNSKTLIVFSVLFSHECTVDFSKIYTAYDQTDWMQKQKISYYATH